MVWKTWFYLSLLLVYDLAWCQSWRETSEFFFPSQPRLTHCVEREAHRPIIWSWEDLRSTIKQVFCWSLPGDFFSLGLYIFNVSVKQLMSSSFCGKPLTLYRRKETESLTLPLSTYRIWKHGRWCRDPCEKSFKKRELLNNGKCWALDSFVILRQTPDFIHVK